MPKLCTFANLWTLWDHPNAGPGEWSLERKLEAVSEAGFQAVLGEPLPGTARNAQARGLRFLAFLRLDGRHDLAGELARCRDMGSAVVQVHLGWHDTSHEEALRLCLGLQAAAAATGMPVVIETHRDTCTETPEKTEALVEAFSRHAQGRELPLLYDFSHHAIVKHLDPPYAPRLLLQPERVRRAVWHHLRPFNGHHAQIPVLTDKGDLSPEMGAWLDFAQELLALLRTGAGPEVWVCPEVGPVRGGYGLSSFPPSWTQALAVKREVERLWERLSAKNS